MRTIALIKNDSYMCLLEQQNRLWRNEVAQKKREKFKAAEAEAKEMQKFNMFKQVSRSTVG